MHKNQRIRIGFVRSYIIFKHLEDYSPNIFPFDFSRILPSFLGICKDWIVEDGIVCIYHTNKGQFLSNLLIYIDLVFDFGFVVCYLWDTLFLHQRIFEGIPIENHGFVQIIAFPFQCLSRVLIMLDSQFICYLLNAFIANLEFLFD